MVSHFYRFRLHEYWQERASSYEWAAREKKVSKDQELGGHSLNAQSNNAKSETLALVWPWRQSVWNIEQTNSQRLSKLHTINDWILSGQAKSTVAFWYPMKWIRNSLGTQGVPSSQNWWRRSSTQCRKRMPIAGCDNSREMANGRMINKLEYAPGNHKNKPD